MGLFFFLQPALYLAPYVYVVWTVTGVYVMLSSVYTFIPVCGETVVACVGISLLPDSGIVNVPGPSFCSVSSSFMYVCVCLTRSRVSQLWVLS
jgi:hypothetical protein